MDSSNEYAADLITEYTSKLFLLGGPLVVTQCTREVMGISVADSDDE